MENSSSQIAGGEIRNVCKIVTGNLGNELELKTSIEIRELDKDIIEKKIEDLTNDIEDNKIKVIKLDKLIADKMVTPDKIEAILTVKAEIQFLTEGLEKEFAIIRKMLSMRGNAEIKVSKSIYLGVRINTELETKFITNKIQLTTIHSKNGIITID